MFEISGNDITNLGDSDLRLLVKRLAQAELRAKGRPLPSVTAGGNQDATDGGIDVCIDCPSVITDLDFVPRPQTGFQVKKPDMEHLFLGNLSARLLPRSGGGSFADLLLLRKAPVMKIADYPDEQVRALVSGVMPELDLWIERERGVIAQVKRASSEEF